jgi:hypothetical protein
MEAIDVSDAARLVRELRAAGLAAWTMSSICRAANRVFKFAAGIARGAATTRSRTWKRGERPTLSASLERRIFREGELAQTIAAPTEPWRMMFRLASVVRARESGLLRLWWQDLDLSDLNAATIRFGFQADPRWEPGRAQDRREARRRCRCRGRGADGARAQGADAGADVAAIVRIRPRPGQPLGQRNVLRALYRAQERARDADGRPTFRELFEHDERGQLVVDEYGEYVRRDVKRRELRLPDFHALRHGRDDALR